MLLHEMIQTEYKLDLMVPFPKILLAGKIGDWTNLSRVKATLSAKYSLCQSRGVSVDDLYEQYVPDLVGVPKGMHHIYSD